jgi:rod shape-determining protein MreD
MIGGLLLGGLGVLAILAAMIPLAPGGTLVPPDILWCLVVACAVRRPRETPLWLIMALGLAADLLLSRPVGLGALALVLSAEAMRANARLFRGAPFLVEWLATSALFALTLAGMEAILRLALSEGPTLGAAARHLAATAFAYPAVVFCLTRLPWMRTEGRAR